MGKIIFVLIVFGGFSLGYGQINDLIISEYSEGSSYNKYIEIFNATGSDIDLSNYQIWRVSNGGTWPEATINLNGTITNGDVFIVAHGSANATILANTNLITGNANWNGNDAVGLAKNNGDGTYALIDTVGVDGADPGLGWDVAGTTNGTLNHTLVRKSTVCATSTNWPTSAGTSDLDSEWIVLDENDWTHIGFHDTSCYIFDVVWQDGAWSPRSPTINTSVTINDDYDTDIGNFRANSLLVNSGVKVNIGNDQYLEVENDVIVDGSLTVQTMGSFVQNSSSAKFILNGEANVLKETPEKLEWYYYTFWSSPVAHISVSSVFPTVASSRRFYFDANNYVDTNGDNVDDNGDAWMVALGTDPMKPGVGYAVTEPHSHVSGETGSALFSGAFNTGDINAIIVHNATNASPSWNLIGNPYPSAIDFEEFQAANSAVVDGVAYFWSQATPPSKLFPGHGTYNFSSNDFAMYSVGLGAGVAGASGKIPSKYVPSGQGFFVAGKTSGTATFTNSIRVADNSSNSQFFKNSSSAKKDEEIEQNKIWINLTSDNGVFNQILVGYVEGATNMDDGLYFDAIKLSANEPALLYSRINGQDKRYAIQGKAPYNLDENEEIKLGFKTNIKVPTFYKLSIGQFQGRFFSQNAIYLKDNFLDIVHDLSDSDYTFTSEEGEFNNRFEIIFKNNMLSHSEMETDGDYVSINVLREGRLRFLISNGSIIKSIQIYDVLGKNRGYFKVNNRIKIISSDKLTGTVLIAKIELSDGNIITRKIIL